MIARVGIGCAVLCVLTFPSVADEPQKPKETKLKPTLMLRGMHSAVRYQTFDLISTKVGWEELWKTHRGPNPRLTELYQEVEVDFDTHYVVVVFTGRCNMLKITPRQRGDVVVIGFKGWVILPTGRFPAEDTHDRSLKSPDRQAIHEVAKEEAQAAYAFLILPKPVKTVIIEENETAEFTGQPVWKMRFLFPAPKNNQ